MLGKVHHVAVAARRKPKFMITKVAEDCDRE